MNEPNRTELPRPMDCYELLKWMAGRMMEYAEADEETRKLIMENVLIDWLPEAQRQTLLGPPEERTTGGQQESLT